MSSNTYNNTDANAMMGNATHNTHNPFTGDGVTNTHNPLTGDKTGPHPPPGTNPMTGRTRDGDLGRNQQQPPDAGTHTMGSGATGSHTMGNTGAMGSNTHNTHNPMTGDGVTNTHNPMTGDKTGTNPPLGTNPVTGRTRDAELGRNDQQPLGGQTGSHTMGAGATGSHNMRNTGTHAGMTGSSTHNTMTGDRTGLHPASGTTGTHTGAGNVGTMGSGSHNTHNTHNPLTGDGVNNTHNPLTGDKTGPNPPRGTNPVTGRTNDGNLGRHEQGAGYAGTDNIHDTTRGTHTTGTATGAHPTSSQTSGGGAKAIVGKVEATLGNILKNPGMQAKGVQKQEEAAAAKAARTEGTHATTGVDNQLPNTHAVGNTDAPRH